MQKYLSETAADIIQFLEKNGKVSMQDFDRFLNSKPNREFYRGAVKHLSKKNNRLAYSWENGDLYVFLSPDHFDHPPKLTY